METDSPGGDVWLTPCVCQGDPLPGPDTRVFPVVLGPVRGPTGIFSDQSSRRRGHVLRRVVLTLLNSAGCSLVGRGNDTSEGLI